MDSHNLFVNVVYLLVAAVIAVAIFVRIRLGSVLEYLLSGVVIGAELEPSKLWSLRRPIFGSGANQLVLSTILIGGFTIFV